MRVNTVALAAGVVAVLTAALAAVPRLSAQPVPGRRVEPPTTVIPREGCVTAECHPGVKNYKYLHGPTHANACDGCHRLVDAPTHRFEDVSSRGEACNLCHVVEIPPGAIVHEPVAQHACLTCHAPHGSADRAMLRGERYADACKTCHQDVTGAHDRVHGPASAGACGACHEPHAARLPGLLVAEGRDLCLRCHVATGQRIDTKPVVHPPALGDCRVCHDPHAADNPALLADEPVALCTGCHADIATKMNQASTQHAAVTSERSCLNCHTPHAGDHAGLLRDKEITLCLECHNQAVTLPDGTKLLNMKQVLEKGRSLHGAIAERSCVVCHEIHGGGHRRLLTNEYPSGLYYPFSDSAYALCFSCHDRQLVQLGTTEEVTAFRNGDRNLHVVHVNRGDKSRSCRVCHDAHAASRDRHIRDEIPFGPAGWKLPIKFESLPDGGRCGAGCHAAFEYSRVNPVVYPADKGAEQWKGTGLIPADGRPPPETTRK